MDRRSFLGAVAAAAATGLLPRSLDARTAVASTPRRVIVIGAGIIGSSVAWHLARRGCDVTILEARGPAAQASGNSFAWLNGGDGGQPHSYHLLRAYALGEHRRIAQELDWPVRWGGSLEWHDGSPSGLVEHVRRMQGRGSAIRVVNGEELRSIEPALVLSGISTLAYAEHDGALDPGKATRILYDAALRQGAKGVAPARVTGISSGSGPFRVATEDDTREADVVVVAAGVGTSVIAEMAGLRLPQQSTPGVIVTTEPMDRIVHKVLYGPDVHVHQRDDGRVVLGEKAGSPQTDEHRALLVGRPNEFPSAELTMAHATRIVDLAKQHVPALAAARVEHAGVGWRPMPADGLPVLGRARSVPGLYFAVMHSGITLAPLIGRLAATEILEGIDLEILSDFRLERIPQG
ncbi:MAG: FAD-binding oxidoreductase [Gammaproteobacteria bacterium]|nr:FAD-binding oxidoreductase [Gammaproteobacteria bacterium]MDH4254270.1 FAD-binding oxidoreductase [Gammaproteobacteria bacterium]MDH5311116.1 FAD-binding oxidoreductase [Gammaproteobacteria bacterium]